MKDNKNFALDTMSREELLFTAERCLNVNKGEKRYQRISQKIVKDGKSNRNLYVTLKMRRALMGFIRPVFEEEWFRRARKDFSLEEG